MVFCKALACREGTCEVANIKLMLNRLYFNYSYFADWIYAHFDSLLQILVVENSK